MTPKPLEFVALDVKPGVAMESQSGLQMKWPKIFGVLANAGDMSTAAIVVHPSSNFMGHYLLPLLPKAGISLLALNTRYVANDSNLIVERVVEDVGAGVRFLRERGFQRVILLGNSGGAATVALYQAEAEKLTIVRTPAGDPVDLRPADIPPADGIALFGAHPGRAELMKHWIDAAVVDENDLLASDSSLDVYGTDITAPFSDNFIRRLRQAQVRRRDEITARVRTRLDELHKVPGAALDESFVVHRTFADPRFVDSTLDANDRPSGSIWGDARAVNYAANGIGRYTTLRSWLSQWSKESVADGPACLARTSVPVLNIEFTADAAVFPSDIARWSAAASGRETAATIVGARHYLDGQPEKANELARMISDWSQCQ